MIYLYLAATLSMLTAAFALGREVGHAAASKAIWRYLENARNGDSQS